MESRKFAKTDMTPSILGFGMMRLKKNADGTLDEQWAVKTLRGAIDRGLSYVDTAYAYGDSERVTGLCLRDGYREKVTLATKIPIDKVNCEADFNRILNEELQRLQTDHIDVYLLHALSRDRWEKVKQLQILSMAEKAKAAGKIRHIGFSFHDEPEVFREILNGYADWDFCQIQLNYMDVDYQAGLDGLRLAHEKGLAVVIMEPLRGGLLANVPSDVAELLPASPVESALDFLWNMPEVNVVLSGMSETEQVEQNLTYAERAHVGMLTEEENAAILAAGDRMRASLQIPCTGCDYCNVCPETIAIPKIFAIYNRLQQTGSLAAARTAYRALEGHAAGKCISCGACVRQCPQHIPVFEKLAQIEQHFA